jgi:hypothetical protein
MSDASDADRRHLRRCVELAEQALASGDEPFGVGARAPIRLAELGVAPPPVRALPIRRVAPHVALAAQTRSLKSRPTVRVRNGDERT